MWMKRCLLVVAALLAATPAWGQAVPSREPSSTHIFPAGGRRGSTVKVRVGGECFPPGMSLRLFGDSITGPEVLGPEVKPHYQPSARRPPRDADGVGAAMSYPREWDATLTIAPDAVLGERHWRVTGGWGGTQLRPFLVGDLPEFIESEPNSRVERAERVTLPVVLNGQIAGERDQDFYTFAAKAGEVVVCDVMAVRIGSPLEPVLTITDASGRRIEPDEVRAGGDPVLAFRAAADGDYRLHVANLGSGGGPAYVYRITVSTRPYVAFAFPPGARAGETRELQLVTLTGTGTPRVARERVTFPTAAGPFTYRDVPLIAGELPDVVETADNHSPTSAMKLTPPATVNARFVTADEEDWFRLDARKDETFTITCQPFPPDSPALPMLTLMDATSKVLAKAGCEGAFERRLRLDWKAPADGTYRLRLRDLQHGARGGPEFIYRLSVRPAAPDFTLALGADHVNVVQGGRTPVDLALHAGGFRAPVELVVDGLPAGVKVEPSRLEPGQERVKLTFIAADDTRPTDTVLRVRGRTVIDGKTLERTSERLCLTVQHRPVIRLTCSEAYQYAHRGSIYPHAMKLERLHGFTGPVVLQLCDRQVQDLDGIEVVEQIIPPETSEVQNRIWFPETMHAGVQHHSRPYAQAYVTFTDKWGRKQTLLTVSEKRCMVRTMPPVVKLRAVRDSATAHPGGEVACALALERTPNFTGPMDVELIGPSGFTAERTHIAEGRSEVIVPVRVAKELRSGAEAVLKFRATGKLPGGATAVSEATLSLKVQ